MGLWKHLFGNRDSCDSDLSGGEVENIHPSPDISKDRYAPARSIVSDTGHLIKGEPPPALKHPPGQLPEERRRAVIRVFVSSTFSDLKNERDALQKDVFLKLEQLCAARQFQFQAVDLRWGVPSEAALDHRTMRICFEELRRCQEVSPRPNFLILLGDRYGWRPLPEEISCDEFDILYDMTTNENERHILQQWYLKDENAFKPVFVLQSRKGAHADCIDYTNKDHWCQVETILWRVINRAFPPEKLRGRFKDGDTAPDRLPSIVRYQASATEQEIWHGALHSPDAPGHVRAFIREIDNLKEYSHSRQIANFVDLDDSGHFDEGSQNALAELKSQLTVRLGKENVISAGHAMLVSSENEKGESALEITTGHLPSLCERVLKELEPLITAQMDEYWAAVTPGKPSLRELERERIEHTLFGWERAPDDAFVGRTQQLQTINDYLYNESHQLLVIHGSSGCGKTSFLAKAAHCHQKLCPVVRFLGTTPQSSNLQSLLLSLCQELRQRYPREDTLPMDIQGLIRELHGHFNAATARNPLILFLDALDQLTDQEGLSLRWIPSAPLPDHVKLVVSCISDESSDSNVSLPFSELRSRGATKHQWINLDIFSEKEANVLFFDRWLPQAGRQLTDEQRRSIEQRLRSKPCRLPFYLRILFEEAKTWRSFDTAAPIGDGVEQLLDAMLSRLAAPENHGPTAECALVYLASGRNGLGETEIRELLYRDPQYRVFLDEMVKKTGQPLPEAPPRIPVAIWSRLRMDLAPYLSEQGVPGGTVVGFYHRQLREIIERRFMTPARKASLHRRIGAYFQRTACPHVRRDWVRSPVRALSELPYHRLHDGRRLYAEHLLTDLYFIEASTAGGLLDQLMADFDLASKFQSTCIATVRDAIRSSAIAIRQRPSQVMPLLVNRLRNQSLGKAAGIHVSRAEAVLNQRGQWLCSLTPFSPIRAVNGVLSISSDCNRLYVLTEQDEIETRDLHTQHVLESWSPFGSSSHVSLTIHPKSGRFAWIDTLGHCFDKTERLPLHLRTRENCFVFIGNGLIGVDSLNQLIFHDLDTCSTAILAEAIDPAFAIASSNSDHDAAVIVSGDRLPTQRIFLLQVAGGISSCKNWPAFDSPVTAVSINQTGTRVLFATRARKLFLYDVETMSLSREITCRNTAGMPIRGIINECSLISYLEKEYAIFATEAGDLCIWECTSDVVNKRGNLGNLKNPSRIRDVAISSGDGQLVVATDKDVQIIPLIGSEQLGVVTPITQCALLGDGTLVATDQASKLVTWYHQGLRRHESFTNNTEPVSVSAYAQMAVVGYTRGAVARHSEGIEPDIEDTLDVFDRAVVSVVSLDDERAIAASSCGQFRIVRFQPSNVLRDIPPVGRIREERFIRRLGPAEDFFCCGHDDSGTGNNSIVVIRADNSMEVVVESPEQIVDACASLDGGQIFVVFREKVCRYVFDRQGWVSDSELNRHISYIVAISENFVVVVTEDRGVSWVELWTSSESQMRTVTAAELPFKCTCISALKNKVAFGGVSGMHCIMEIKEGVPL